MEKLVAEFIGTFTLVLFGCGAAVIAGMGSGATSIDVLGISMAFGLAIVAMAYGIGPVSACHVNPAVSFGVIIEGRMSVGDFIGYAIAQILGALAGAAILYLVLSGKTSGWTGGGLARTAGVPAISANTPWYPRWSSKPWRPSSSWSASSASRRKVRRHIWQASPSG